MRRVFITSVVFLTTALAAISLFPPSTYFIWNRTDSAPKGLYWRSDSRLTLNGWAVVSGKAPAAIWISEQGFLAPDWPIIKRVRGVTGDNICRENGMVFVNGKQVAQAILADSAGRELPSWDGCFTLGSDEIFLLNDHPLSLDGRYFGATKLQDVTGSARLLIAAD
ncbi:MAG: S26 family signal peptidase [Pseudomonadota bacterium]